MESLSKTIRTTLIERGAGLVGFADLEGVSDSIEVPMRYAVSIAVALDASIIRDISNGPNAAYFEEYKRANSLLGRLCRERDIDDTICGICINVCPWTQKYLKKGLGNRG